MVEWDYFDQFETGKFTEEGGYLPLQGDGENKAQQIVTAVSKLVYKWYNDGDVFDNNHGMQGWANDLSPYANWLYSYAGAKDILDRIYDIYKDEDYEALLKDLADRYLAKDFLVVMENQPKVGSIYHCDGPFEFNDHFDDEWEDEEEEE